MTAARVHGCSIRQPLRSTLLRYTRKRANWHWRSEFHWSQRSKEFAREGGLLALSTNYRALIRRSATYVDKILKGAKPGELPIERPTMFTLTINLNAAKSLGITVPPSLLARADEVIE